MTVVFFFFLIFTDWPKSLQAVFKKKVSATWVNEFANEECELFDCPYGKCFRVGKRGFRSRDSLNSHVIDIHWPDYCSQKQAMTLKLEFKLTVDPKLNNGKTNVSEFADFEQCCACPQFFSPTSLKHVRYCIGKGRKRLFDSDCFKLWCDYEMNRLFQMKKGGKGLTPQCFLAKYFGDAGFTTFENVILNGDYNRILKDNFVSYSGVNEPQRAFVRYYLVASKKLNMIYLGYESLVPIERIHDHYD